MPLTNAERDALRALAAFARRELTEAGNPDSGISGLPALDESQMAAYRSAVEIERDALYASVTGSPAEVYWETASNLIRSRLLAEGIDRSVILGSSDERVRWLGKQTLVMLGLQRTIHEAG